MSNFASRLFVILTKPSMNYEYIKQGDLNRNYGVDIDNHIKVRDRAKLDLSQSRTGLINMGAQLVIGDQLFCTPSMDMRKFFACNNQEFSWEAEYEDGTLLKQFSGKEQLHYGNIDQSKLKEIRWVSNFDYETANTEKRVIISLNFKTGVFTFTNGFAPQEIRGISFQEFKAGFVPKLVLKMIKRTSTSVGFIDGNVEEVMYYNRFLLGWESAQGSAYVEKKVLCIEPNGFVHSWDIDN